MLVQYSINQTDLQEKIQAAPCDYKRFSYNFLSYLIYYFGAFTHADIMLPGRC
jgi:hypothetical protein